jgi:hypothetical protein
VNDYFAPALREMKEYRSSLTTNSTNVLGLICESADEKAIACHHLQGIESSFIAWLVLISSDYDYEAIVNFHDGLWVRGSIPEEAIERARELSDFTTAKFIEKAIL